MNDHAPDVLNDPTAAADLIETARAWMLDDPDPQTVAEIASLVERASSDPNTPDAARFGVFADPRLDAEAVVWDALEELQLRFSGRLSFGTAGLRGEVGAGESMMNSKVVMQTSAGFAQFLLKRAAERASTASATPSVVIGFDGRVASRQFALDAAQVLAGAGVSVTLLDGPVPTPVVAFAVRHLGVSAGVMITASHNPPQDNGYKVYLGDADAGSQIAPPVDAQIAAFIDVAAAQPLTEFPRDVSVSFDADVLRSVLEAYVAATVSHFRASSQLSNVYTNVHTFEGYQPTSSVNASPPRIVYTAMHGVGFELTKRVFAEAGLPNFLSVREQQQPDGTFPTVDFPNPEEPGALDLATAFAKRERADLIIAHDPDADRLAAALPNRERLGDRDIDGFTQLTGNELGLLLGWECAARASTELLKTGRPGTLAATIVSSPALGVVAADYGLDFVQTLSGFKWVSRVPHLIFGFEEALGYLVNPDVVRDKDGISAAMLLADIASRLHSEGKTLWDRLDEASERFGHFASDQITLRLKNTEETERLTTRIRSNPPTALGQIPVSEFVDYYNPGYMPVPANVLQFSLEDGSRVMIRPSGTEQKLKVYLDADCSVGSLEERRTTVTNTLRALKLAALDMVSLALDPPIEMT